MCVRFSRVQGFVHVDIVCIRSGKVHVFQSVSPRYLWVSVPVSIILFMNSVGGVEVLIYEKILWIIFSCIKSNQPCVCPSNLW